MSDSIAFLVVMFVFALAVIIGKFVYSTVDTEVQATMPVNSLAANISSNLNSRYVSIFDSGFLFVFFILWIAVIVASFSIDTHPWFFGIILIILLFLLVVAAYLGNVYETVSTSSTLSSTATQFTLTNFIMNHIFEVFMVVSFTIAIALYMKGRA